MPRYLLPAMLALLVPLSADAQVAGTAAEKARADQVRAAIMAIQDKKPEPALALLGPAIAEYEKLYVPGVVDVRCTEDESRFGAKLGTATLIPNGYCYGLWARGFALVELGRLPESLVPLTRAAALMPDNAQFQTELGYVHQSLKHWSESSAAYTLAADAAQKIQDKSARNLALRRAWFGLGFNLIELGKLDEAEAYFNKALEVAPGDQKLLNELQYIKEQRAKAKAS